MCVSTGEKKIEQDHMKILYLLFLEETLKTSEWSKNCATELESIASDAITLMTRTAFAVAVQKSREEYCTSGRPEGEAPDDETEKDIRHHALPESSFFFLNEDEESGVKRDQVQAVQIAGVIPTVRS